MALKGRSRTKPGTLLRSQIPVRTFSDWSEQEAGITEMGLVAHDGSPRLRELLHAVHETHQENPRRCASDQTLRRRADALPTRAGFSTCVQGLKARLHKRYAALNPAALKRETGRSQKRLAQLITRLRNGQAVARKPAAEHPWRVFVGKDQPR